MKFDMDEIDVKIRNHKFIIFGSDHCNTLGAVRSLGEAGISPILILHPKYSNHPHMSTNSKYVSEIYLVDTVEQGLDLIITKYGQEELKPFLYSCDDWVEGILDMNYDTLKDRFFFFNGKENGIVSYYMNKDAISRLGEACGLLIPKAEVLKKGELPSSLRYPVITKSIMSTKGGWKKDVKICWSEQELIKAYDSIASEEVLVEEFIEKETEVCYDGYTINNGKDMYIPYKSTYIRSLPGAYGNYFVCAPPEEPQLIKGLEKMFQIVGFNGIFSAEFLLDKKGNYYFLEINFRNSTWSYAMTYGGANLLYEWAKSTYIGKIETLSTKSKKPFTCMVEFRDFVDFVMTRRISLFKWLKDLHSSDCVLYYNRRDKKPFYCHLSRIIKRFLHLT